MKTGAFKELAPYEPDWYYIRAGEKGRFSSQDLEGGVGTCPNNTSGRISWHSLFIYSLGKDN